MLRSDKELAIDDITELSKYAADQFAKMAEMCQDPALSGMIVEFEGTHRRHVLKLEETVREMGNLPPAPDPDREAFSRLATRMKAALAEDRDRVVAENCRDIENRIIDAVRSAGDENFSDDICSLLSDIGKECGRMCRRLDEFLKI